MSDLGFSWCPECKKWVPERELNSDYDRETNTVTRVCNFCLEGTSDQNNFVYDPDFEKVHCIYCDSTDVVEQRPQWRWYVCNQCGSKFKLM